METLTNLSLSHYVLLFGLGEIYVMTLILAIVFWFKWRRLRHERRGLEQVCQSIRQALDDEIARSRAHPLPSPALQSHWLAWLDNWQQPFAHPVCYDESAWRPTLNALHARAVQLANDLRELPPPAARAAIPADSAGDAGPPEAEFSGLLESHRRSVETLSGIGRTNTDLNDRFEKLQQKYAALKEAIGAGDRPDRERLIQELLDQIALDNEAILAMSGDLNRQRRYLEAQLEEFRQYIDSLEMALGHQRHLMHGMMLERDSLAQENKVSAVRLQDSVRLVGRLNRSLNALQREYEKLYQSIR